MKALIISKTHMRFSKCCVGAVGNNGQFLRLLNAKGENQPVNTSLEIGQLYEVECVPRGLLVPPHIEDVLLTDVHLLDTLSKKDVVDFLKQVNIPIWKGHPNNLFDSKLIWTRNGSGHIIKSNIPNNSVGFWISNQPLIKSVYYDKVRYSYNDNGTWSSLPYVGFEAPIPVIRAGTLVRVSLARWWKREDEDRCQLQLSGWY